MRWLRHRRWSPRMHGDEGAIAVIVLAGILIFVMGIGAMVVDWGNIASHRRSQQNGADAAVLAVARTCAQGACDTSTAATSTAGRLVSANDDKAQVWQICGTVTGLSACPPATGKWADCDATTTTLPYVQLYTEVSDSGATKLSPIFFDSAGFPVIACARAALGVPGGLTSSLPLTMSLCEWQKFTSNGTVYAPPPPYPPFPTSYDHVIYFHSTSNPDNCPAGPSGADLPGGFGWLQTSSGCTATSTSGDWYSDSTGVPPPNSCQVTMMQAMKGQIVYVPVFDNTNGLTGSNGSYHVSGYAAFFLAGYYIVGQYKEKDLATGTYPCGGNDSCISGWFTTGLTSGTPSAGGGANYGATAVGLIG